MNPHHTPFRARHLALAALAGGLAIVGAAPAHAATTQAPLHTSTLNGDSRAQTATPNAAGSTAKDSITVRSTERLTPQDVTNGGVAGTGRFSISGAIHATGKVTDYRTVRTATALSAGL